MGQAIALPRLGLSRPHRPLPLANTHPPLWIADLKISGRTMTLKKACRYARSTPLENY